MLAKFANKAENNSLKVNSPSLDKIQVLVMALENVNVNYFMCLRMRERIQTINCGNTPEFPGVWEALRKPKRHPAK